MSGFFCRQEVDPKYNHPNKNREMIQIHPWVEICIQTIKFNLVSSISVAISCILLNLNTTTITNNKWRKERDMILVTWMNLFKVVMSLHMGEL